MGGRVGDYPGAPAVNNPYQNEINREGGANSAQPPGPPPNLQPNPPPTGWVQPVGAPSPGPLNPRAGGARQVAPVNEVAPTAQTELQRPPRLTGRMEMSENGNKWTMTLKDGQSIDLVNAPNGVKLPGTEQQMNPMMSRAFLDDNIEMTVRGSLGADGKFQVEDFSPGKSDRYVSGRVQLRHALNGQTIERGTPEAKEAKVVVATARGDVEVTNPDLAEKFRLAGPLGVILPGDPKIKDGKPVYDLAPSQYFALGRPQKMSSGGFAPELQADGTFMTQHAMAFHGFNGPTELAALPGGAPDENAAARVRDNKQVDRNWLLGDFTLGTGDKAGRLTKFTASYVTGAAGYFLSNSNAMTLPDTRYITDKGALAGANAEIKAMRDGNQNLAAVEMLVNNQSHTSPPVDFAAFNIRAAPPKPKP